MIKLSEIVNTNRTVSITEKGVEDTEKITTLIGILQYFNIDPGVVYEHNSDKFHLTSNLQIWIDESILKFGEKIPLSILLQRITKRIGSFNGIDELEKYVKSLAEAGLVNY